MTVDLRKWAFASTLAGGALILAAAAMMAIVWAVVGTAWGPGHGGMMDAMGISMGVVVLWGSVVGLVVLGAAVRMRPEGPGEGVAEGLAAIVASALSFPAMGGFMIGAILGVVGGALSIAHADG